LNFYHDLGSIIYYGNASDIFLRNTIILRPQKLVDIFKMVLDAKMPAFMNTANELNNNNGLDNESNSYERSSSSRRQSNARRASNNTIKWLEMWQKFDKYGILNDSLLDMLWKGFIDQKPGLLGLMKKFDLICDRNGISGQVKRDN
jgi:hypothetical protein